MKWLCAMVVLGASAGLAVSGNRAMPKEAKTTDELIQALDQIKGFGIPQHRELKWKDTKHFVLSNNPYSGRAAVMAFTYRFEPKTKTWVLRDFSEFEMFAQVAASVDEKKGDIVYRNGGKELKRLAIVEKKAE